jgi:mRNA interferase HigB
MHIISQSRLKDFWLKHPQAKVGLQVWYKITSKARWQTPNDVQQVFANKVDIVQNFTVFDIGGNKYRLITYIDYKKNKIFIRNILTHTEYDKEQWKKDNWYK